MNFRLNHSFPPVVCLLLLTVWLLAASCGNSKQQETRENADSEQFSFSRLDGDSTVYGLACEGCTDSVLVLLPYSGEDPDTFDIISAWQQHRIYGRPHIGDELAVVLNPADREEALSVINVKALCATWCYMVKPVLRNVENLSPRMQRRMLSDLQTLPDSLKDLWLTPREYSLRLKSDNTAMNLGGMRHQTVTDDMTPVEFPSVRRYTEWHVFNGRLILKADTVAGFSADGELPVSDTVDIRMLTEDTLVLSFPDREQGYYRK